MIERGQVWEIIPGRLWQSGTLDEDPVAAAKVRELDIEYVVNLCGEEPFVSGRQGKRPFTELFWEIEDGPLPDLSDLEDVVGRVCAAVSAGKKVLVHCYAGMNRSGLVSAMAVNKLTGRSGPQLVGFMRRKRPGCLTNRRFVQYLETL